MQLRQTLALWTLASRLPGERPLLEMNGDILWTQQRFSGVRSERRRKSKDKGCTVLANVGPFVIRPSSVVCPVFISEKLSIVNILQVVWPNQPRKRCYWKKFAIYIVIFWGYILLFTICCFLRIWAIQMALLLLLLLPFTELSVVGLAFDLVD